VSPTLGSLPCRWTVCIRYFTQLYVGVEDSWVERPVKELKGSCKKPRPRPDFSLSLMIFLQAACFSGGRCWDRTSGLCRVKSSRRPRSCSQLLGKSPKQREFAINPTALVRR